MPLRETLTGRGKVLVRGKAVGDADYRIEPHGQGQTGAAGVLSASRPIIRGLKTGEPGHLALQDGGTVTFVTTEAKWTIGQASFVVQESSLSAS